MKKRFSQLYGWVFVRPRRWFFRKMWCAYYLRTLPEKDFRGWHLPNVHWWILDKTIFKFFRWLYWDAWRKFCTYEDGWLKHKPLFSKIIHRIGSTTAGFAIGGGECYHCASVDGDPVDLADDKTGEFFIFEKSWTCSTMDGTDYRFCGTTICPTCGYRQFYEDSSL